MPPRCRERQGNRCARSADGVLARAYARRHVPPVGPRWHLDAANVHTLDIPRGAAHCAGRSQPDPSRHLYRLRQWFRVSKGLELCEGMVAELRKPPNQFEAVLDNRERIAAQQVVAAPVGGPCGTRARYPHLVRFKDLAGVRVQIVGGHQSAYEWAALIGSRFAAMPAFPSPHPCRFETQQAPASHCLLTHRTGWLRSMPGSSSGSRYRWQTTAGCSADFSRQCSRAAVTRAPPAGRFPPLCSRERHTIELEVRRQLVQSLTIPRDFIALCGQLSNYIAQAVGGRFPFLATERDIAPQRVEFFRLPAAFGGGFG